MGDRSTEEQQLARRLLAAVASVLGLWLLFGDVTTVDATVRLVGAVITVVGIGRWLTARESDDPAGVAVAVGWVGIGVLGIVQPGLELRAYAIVVGIALVIGALLDLVRGFRGSAAAPTLISSAAGGLLGVAALAWPTVTVLVMAVVAGARALVFAVTTVLAERRERPTETTWKSYILPVAGSVLALVLVVVAVAINRSQPRDLPDFYTAAAETSDAPGELIRSERVDGFLDGAVTHRVLYTSTDRDGAPVTATGLVIVPDTEAPADGRPVVAITHGTMGIARECSPSAIGPAYAAGIGGLHEYIDAGFVVAAPDYAGLGSDATAGYLVGLDEGYSTLDAVRSAADVPGSDASDSFVVFGESQGGHASLFTGELASDYAPDLDLVGVAAAAPATDLPELFEANAGTPFGDILASYALVSWAEVYADRVDLAEVVDSDARPAVERLADLCLQDERQIASLFPEAAILSERFLTTPPWEVDSWSQVLQDNVPGQQPTAAPVLVLQGEDDPLVRPAIQERWIDTICATGTTVEYRTYPGVGHIGAGHATAADAVEWSLGLLAGDEALSTC